MEDLSKPQNEVSTKTAEKIAEEFGAPALGLGDVVQRVHADFERAEFALRVCGGENQKQSASA